MRAVCGQNGYQSKAETTFFSGERRSRWRSSHFDVLTYLFTSSGQGILRTNGGVTPKWISSWESAAHSKAAWLSSYPAAFWAPKPPSPPRRLSRRPCRTEDPLNAPSLSNLLPALFFVSLSLSLSRSLFISRGSFPVSVTMFPFVLVSLGIY